MTISTNYQFLQAAAFGELSKMQSLVENRAANHLDVEAVDADGSVLKDASERFRHYAVKWQHSGMNALHLSCLMGHEHVIQYLTSQFPVLHHGRCETGETPLHTLARTIGLVQTISDQCFDSFLSSGAPLDSSTNLNANCLHYLAKLKNPSKLVLYLNVFVSSIEDTTSLLSQVLPNSLIKIIVTYGNFYAKTTIPSMLHQKQSFLDDTPLCRANEHTSPLLLQAAGAAGNTTSPVAKPSQKRKSIFQYFLSAFS